jgi:hypothetical protein
MTEKFFNTAGPIKQERHYFIPVTDRINLPEILSLIDQEKYFVLHAPRQSGKTSTLLELTRILNGSGKYKCLYVNVESAQTARENVAEAMTVIVQELVRREKNYFPADDILGSSAEEALRRSPTSAFGLVLGMWARQSPLPTVLLVDEIDSLIGDTLVSVLRQLRGGYDARPKDFPQSVILCGVRDVRDYRIHVSSGKEPVTGGSAFNINAKSLTMGPFSAAELRDLYRQHTAATGQVFTEEALELAYDLTRGQPWLVNALAYQACFEDPRGKDRSQPISADLILAAKESLILRRVTHLDQLADKLKEPRVRSVIEPMVRGEFAEDLNLDDVEYVIDLGLVVNGKSGFEIANPIYQEVIPRQLTWLNQTQLKSVVDDAWYIQPDGSIAIDKLLEDFQKFFRENSESWIERFDYKEAGPQLLLQAYLQRVINGGGRIDREYGLGRGRTDLLLTWPYAHDASGRATQVQRAVFELKILHKSKKETLAEGLAQTKMYLDRVGEKAGHLLIFNRQPKVPWRTKIYRKVYGYEGCRITVWGM